MRHEATSWMLPLWQRVLALTSAFVLATAGLLVFAAPAQAAAPVAVNDAYNVVQDTTLVVAAPGLLLNDTGGPPLYARIVSGTGNGTLVPNPVATTNPVNLTSDPSGDIQPSWSPDGSEIAFRSVRDGDAEIYKMNSDGTGLVKLTNNSAAEDFPMWSSDGFYMVFDTNRDGNYEIYVMKVDGSGQTRLTTDGALDVDPAWSPDGTQIVFRSQRDGNSEIYKMNADGSSQTRLTSNGAFDQHPHWSPDGTQIAFTSDRDGNQEIYVMNADGTGQTRITMNTAADANPSWSRNGSKILFDSNRDGGDQEIYVMEPDGSAQTRLTNSPGKDSGPDWSPDGSQITWRTDRDVDNEIYKADLLSDGAFLYTPETGFTGVDSFTYVANDGVVESSPAAVTLTVGPPADTISGTVFDDIVGDALNDGVVGDGVNPGVEFTDVHLYLDVDGDGMPEATDTYLATDITDVNGDYSFTGLTDVTKYFVVIDSKTVRPSVAATSYSDIWAEQTYGPSLSWCADGAGGSATIGAPGPCYGGKLSGVSDDLATWYSGAEHIARVPLAGADATEVDFGFSFNVVTTTVGGNAQDDDPAVNLRSVQGSLRQFIANANAITGGNVMRFVPAEAVNEPVGSEAWWRIAVSMALPIVTDPLTTLDGTAYSRVDGITLSDPNTGVLGTGGFVGIDLLGLPQVEKSELELAGSALADGIVIEADDATVRRIALWGFSSSAIRVGDPGVPVDYVGTIVEENIIGSGPGALVDPGAGNRPQDAVRINHADDGFVQNNLIAFAEQFGVRIQASGTDRWTVRGNEVRSTGLFLNGGVDAKGADGAFTGNLIVDTGGTGVVLAGSGNVVENNTIGSSGQRLPRAGITALLTSDAEIRKNVITASSRGGILVGIISPSGVLMSQNLFGGNGANAIDLLEAGAVSPATAEGDGVSPNTAAPPSCGTDAGSNEGLDAPVISSASSTTVTGTACAGATVEVYRAVADGDASDTLTGTDYGEGVEYLGTAVANFVTGAWTLSGITELVGGDAVSATATNASNSTSEFGANVKVPGGFVVNSTGDLPDSSPGDGICTTGFLNSELNVECTLRAAIEETSALPSADLVTFDMPTLEPGYNAGGAYWTIAINPSLPPVANATTINGTTQAGYVANTTVAPGGLDGKQVVVLDGLGGGLGNGLTLDGDDISVSGLTIGRFDGNGIEINGANATVSAVYVGTNPTGAIARPNTGDGIQINGADANIGGLFAAARALVSGNDGQGIEVIGIDATLSGVVIGLDATTATDVPNGRNGIRLSGTSGAVVGAPGGGNVVLGNNLAAATADGIYVSGGSNHTLQSNLIGTNDIGTPLGNYAAGIAVSSATSVLIGGALAGEGNSIAHNGTRAVNVSGTSDNVSILGNAIWSNGALGIDLVDVGDPVSGVTPNDGGDGDPGPNLLLNYPVITSAAEAGGTVTVDFDLDVPDGSYRVEFFANPGGADGFGYGEGEAFVASLDVSVTAGAPTPASHAFAGSIGDVITATTTEGTTAPFGSTSEFSAAVSVVPGGIFVNSTRDFADAAHGNGVCDTGLFNTIGAVECTLRAAIEEANAWPGADVIAFRIPTSELGHSPAPLSYTIQPASVLPPIGEALTIDGTSQPDHGATPIIVIDGNAAGVAVDGLTVTSGDTTIEGLVITCFSAAGLVLLGGANNKVYGNYIGPDVTGLGGVGNGANGVNVNGSSSNEIGGPNPGEGNIVSNNPGDGISIFGPASTGNVVAGNLIGVDATGATAFGNASEGIVLSGSATSNTIGGITPSWRNVISGNGSDGVVIDGATTTGNSVINNYIGLNAGGSGAVANGGDGVELAGGAAGNAIGGVGLGNVISGNTDAGVHFSGAVSMLNLVAGNSIGSDQAGTSPVPNQNGIRVSAPAQFNVIGGTAPGAGNLIAFNAQSGIVLEVAGARDIQILGNSIHGNLAGLGIDLDNDGVTLNSPVDSGANELLNYPEITSALETAGTVDVGFDLEAPPAWYRIEFFANTVADSSGFGEGETLVSTVDVDHTGGSGPLPFSHSFAGSAGDILTATATECTDGATCATFGSTSEFSAAAVVGFAALVVNSTGDLGDLVPGDGICHTGFTNSELDPECTLRAAI